MSRHHQNRKRIAKGQLGRVKRPFGRGRNAGALMPNLAEAPAESDAPIDPAQLLADVDRLRRQGKRSMVG